MESHPVARIFPMMTAAEFEELKRDISANGQREAIWTYQGQIIDGRNRYKACSELGIDPHFREWDGEGSLTAFVVSLNLHRRHLTTSQRSVIALDILPMLEAEAKERQRAAGGDRGNQYTGGKVAVVPELEQAPKDPPKRSIVQAAELVGVSKSNVGYAKAIAKESPEKIEEIREGKTSVDAAYKEIRQKEAKPMREEPPVGGKVETRDMVAKPWSNARQFSQIAISQLTRIRDEDPQRVAALMEVKDYIEQQLAKGA